MQDISLALGLIGFLSIAIFLGMVRLLRNIPQRLLDVSAVAIVLLMAAYVRWVWGELWIVQWIPLPSAIVLTNWFPLLLGALGAVVWVRLDGGTPAKRNAVSTDEDTSESAPDDAHHNSQSGLMLRRAFAMTLIVGAAIWSVMYFIPLTVPECDNAWYSPSPVSPWPVCRQTHDSTCSAASSATILLTLGIETTEQEMARLCLTKRGTTWLGLYHGLSQKLIGTNHRVEFFEAEVGELPLLADRHPLLLCCKLDSAMAKNVPKYVTDGGWIPGTAHSVVYFGRLGERHVIGDPSRGYELWTDRDLEILWTGQGLKIGHINSNQPENEG